MKTLISIMALLFCAVASQESKPKDLEFNVEIQEVEYSTSELLDYERIIEIDSMQQALQNEKAGLVIGLSCRSDCGIERATNRQLEDPLLFNTARSRKSHLYAFRTDKSPKPNRTIKRPDNTVKKGHYSFTDASQPVRTEFASVR